ncbi:MAG: zf-HC2 domain-containing protein [Chloroflexi bacterium]|nr:zf-HC2 domain-containing protein [Chloroflexota bacterium]MBU1748607.1 zf-HC2 domain-containing protein [Chloroflexota bacterium]MBU1879223.1 zf-HC2 domain-containing protein [Chloroflexota bacterium]
MRCQDVERDLALYLDERAAAPWSAELDEHLADCPACRTEWAMWQHVESLFAHTPQTEPPAEFVGAVLARVATVTQVAPASVRLSRRRYWAGGGLVATMPLAAALLVSLIVWGLAAYGLAQFAGPLTQTPLVINTFQILVQQAGFWLTTLAQTAGVVLMALLPCLVLGIMAFMFLSALAYMLVLAWGWLIGRVWWPGNLQSAI